MQHKLAITMGDQLLVRAFQKYIHTVPDMVWVTDGDFKLLMANQPFWYFLGVENNSNPHYKVKAFISQCSQLNSGDALIFDGKAIMVEKQLLDADSPLGFMFIGKQKEHLATEFSDTVYLLALLENIPFQIYFKDKESRFTYMNQQQAATLGIQSPRDAIGKTDFDFFTSDHAQSALKDEQRIMKTGNPLVLKKERIRNPDGSFSWVNTTKAAIKNTKGEVIGIVGITYDVNDKVITENKLKKAKKKAEESDNLKSAFLANMSHEIRTPMNGIIGFVNLLKEPDITPEEKKEFFGHIESCTNALLTLIDDIIDISKIESGQISIKITDFNLNELMSDIFKTFNGSIKSNRKDQVELIFNQPALDTNHVIMRTDLHRLRQIITNLLSNAYKFTEKGTVELGYELKGEGFIKFYVKDTGIGIPENQKDVIFKRFGQANQSIYLSNKGTGLGLSISKNLVNMLGGNIWFESEMEKGSTFYFQIPQQYEEALEFNIKHLEIPNWKNKTALMVGPFDGFEKNLKAYFFDSDINLLWADNFDDAVTFYTNNSLIDIILLECSNDTGKSLEMLGYFKHQHNEIPIIGIMVLPTHPGKNLLLEHGCTDVIVRPIEKQAFLDGIVKYIV
jgi:PAS domain S-box-containing protein